MENLDHFWQRVKNLIYLDTRGFELFSGLICLAWAVALLLPNEFFPPGPTFGKDILVAGLITVHELDWAVLFGFVGLTQIFSLIYNGGCLRKWASLLTLYLWILVCYYILKYSYFSVFPITHALIMVWGSIWGYLRLWRYRPKEEPWSV